MSNAFMRKLETVTDLSTGDREALQRICWDVRSLPAKKDIIHQGDTSKQVHLIVEGWAERYEDLDDGSRQITAFLLPGDLTDQDATMLGAMDHSIRTTTACQVAYLSGRDLDNLMVQRPELARALRWSTLVDKAVLRQWIVSLGRRNAHQRITHLLCELHARLRHIGLAEDSAFEFPLTQVDLADALGLTSVHVNRTLQRLRSENLIELDRHMLIIPDLDKLRDAAGFRLSYLHNGIRSLLRPEAYVEPMISCHRPCV